MESFFSHLKTETLYFTECKTEELFQAIKKYIWFYNHERFQKNKPVCSGGIPKHTGLILFG
nr:IS3 family transposase [Brevibacillus laterosporus]